MTNTRQAEMWTTPAAAAIGELLERLAAWCDSQKHLSFTMQRTSVHRVKRLGGVPDPIRGWAIDVRRRGAIVQTLTAGTLEELARVGNGWLAERVEGARK